MHRFHFCQIIIIIVGTLIPIINVFGFQNNISDTGVRIWSSIFGGTIAILTGFLQLAKAHESWILYRSTAESLKREYHLFSLYAGEYAAERDSDNRTQLFIRRVESIIAAEGNKFVTSRHSSDSKSVE